MNSIITYVLFNVEIINLIKNIIIWNIIIKERIN